MNVSNKQEYRDLLDDLCQEYCEKGHYCILREFLVSAHTSPRILTQLKCVEKMKFEKSKAAEKDIGWADAMELWVSEGHAAKFAELYSDDIKFAALYKKIMAKPE